MKDCALNQIHRHNLTYPIKNLFSATISLIYTMRFTTSAIFLLPLIASSLARSENLYERDVELLPSGWKTELYARNAEALITEHLERRDADPMFDGPGKAVDGIANFIAVMASGCPKPGQPDYPECKRCRDRHNKKKGKRDILERRKGGGGKGGKGASKPKVPKPGEESDADKKREQICKAWKF
jgi:hypothetical protein